jgi:hypothetical protein
VHGACGVMDCGPWTVNVACDTLDTTKFLMNNEMLSHNNDTSVSAYSERSFYPAILLIEA